GADEWELLANRTDRSRLGLAVLLKVSLAVASLCADLENLRGVESKGTHGNPPRQRRTSPCVPLKDIRLRPPSTMSRSKAAPPPSGLKCPSNCPCRTTTPTSPAPTCQVTRKPIDGVDLGRETLVRFIQASIPAFQRGRRRQVASGSG